MPVVCSGKTNAQKITDELAVFGFKVSLKAIQYGTERTRYVFDDSSRQNIEDLKQYECEIADILKIKRNKLRIVAPWGDMFCVVVEHNAVFDPLNKKVLRHWLLHDGGRASIASVQRGLGIRFNRAGKIMDQLQKLGCVERPSSSDDVSQPLKVKVTLQDVDILFPQSLGWD